MSTLPPQKGFLKNAPGFSAGEPEGPGLVRFSKSPTLKHDNLKTNNCGRNESQDEKKILRGNALPKSQRQIPHCRRTERIND